MLLELARWLAQDIRGFYVFNYITLRAVLATLTALIISFMVGANYDTQAHAIQGGASGAR